VTSLKLERGTADVKVPSQHLSGMVEDNDGNPVELISVGSDSNMGPLRYESVQNTSSLLSVGEQKQLW